MYRPVLSALLRAAIVAAVAIQSFSSGSALAQDEPRTIRVSASATASAAPDRARVGIHVVSNAASADDAASENANVSRAVYDAVAALVGPGGKTTTSGYRLAPDYEYVNRNGRNERKLKGYVATNSVRAETADLDGVGGIIDAAVTAGATEAGDIQFYLADDTTARRQATLEAGRRARGEAETLAEALGVTLGDLLDASTVGASVIPQPRMGRMMAMEASADTATPVQADDVDVRVNVSAVFGVR